MLSFRQFLKSKSRRDVTECTDKTFTQDLNNDTLMDYDNENSFEDEVSSETWSVSRESCDSDQTVNKTVSFNNVVMVSIVPSRQDLNSVWKDLWWSSDECDGFKKQADWELNAHSNEYECDFKESIRSLYQPDIESLRMDEESQHQFKILYGVHNKHKFRSTQSSSNTSHTANTNTYSHAAISSIQSQNHGRNSSFSFSTPSVSGDGSSNRNTQSSKSTTSNSSNHSTRIPTSSSSSSVMSIDVTESPQNLLTDIPITTTLKAKTRNGIKTIRNNLKRESLHKKLNPNHHDDCNNSTSTTSTTTTTHFNNNNHHHHHHHHKDVNNNIYQQQNQINRNTNTNNNNSNINNNNNEKSFKSSHDKSNVTRDDKIVSLYGNLGIMGNLF